ncbi:MAG: hypothetical protein WC321_03705 [Candidatus Omnitrophota bacterium]
MKILLVLLSLMIFTETSGAQEVSFQKGISYVAWEKERYASEHSDKSLEMLAETGAEWVAIIPTWYQEKFDSTRLFATEKTSSDRSLIHVINKAHTLGLKVMLKPHIDLIDQSGGLCRSDIGFQEEEDWQEWFSGYLKFIRHYAKLARDSGVELFCVGTELSFASQRALFWEKEVIPAVREIYSGDLTYAANWDEYKNIRFWKSLDYIGIDAYFPLVEKSNPGYEEIEAGWIKWADEIEAWQRSVNKPLIFTEIGYASCQVAAARPWENPLSASANLEIQANCYKAAMNVLSKRDWCNGLYWWYWRPSPYSGGFADKDFTPQNKPAQIVLTDWYKGLTLARLSR